MPDVGASHANASAAAARYRLSFTAGGLMHREADIAIGLHRELHDWSAVRQRANEQNLFQARTQSAAKRTARERVQRLAELTDAELHLFVDAITTERCHLFWPAQPLTPEEALCEGQTPTPAADGQEQSGAGGAATTDVHAR